MQSPELEIILSDIESEVQELCHDFVALVDSYDTESSAQTEYHNGKRKEMIDAKAAIMKAKLAELTSQVHILQHNKIPTEELPLQDDSDNSLPYFEEEECFWNQGMSTAGAIHANLKVASDDRSIIQNRLELIQLSDGLLNTEDVNSASHQSACSLQVDVAQTEQAITETVREQAMNRFPPKSFKAIITTDAKFHEGLTETHRPVIGSRLEEKRQQQSNFFVIRVGEGLNGENELRMSYGTGHIVADLVDLIVHPIGSSAEESPEGPHLSDLQVHHHAKAEETLEEEPNTREQVNLSTHTQSPQRAIMESDTGLLGVSIQSESTSALDEHGGSECHGTDIEFPNQDLRSRSPCDSGEKVRAEVSEKRNDKSASPIADDRIGRIRSIVANNDKSASDDRIGRIRSIVANVLSKINAAIGEYPGKLTLSGLNAESQPQIPTIAEMHNLETGEHKGIPHRQTGNVLSTPHPKGHSTQICQCVSPAASNGEETAHSAVIEVPDGSVGAVSEKQKNREEIHQPEAPHNSCGSYGATDTSINCESWIYQVITGIVEEMIIVVSYSPSKEDNKAKTLPIAGCNNGWGQTDEGQAVPPLSELVSDFASHQTTATFPASSSTDAEVNILDQATALLQHESSMQNGVERLKAGSDQHTRSIADTESSIADTERFIHGVVTGIMKEMMSAIICASASLKVKPMLMNAPDDIKSPEIHKSTRSFIHGVVTGIMKEMMSAIICAAASLKVKPMLMNAPDDIKSPEIQKSTRTIGTIHVNHLIDQFKAPSETFKVHTIELGKQPEVTENEFISSGFFPSFSETTHDTMQSLSSEELVHDMLEREAVFAGFSSEVICEHARTAIVPESTKMIVSVGADSNMRRQVSARTCTSSGSSISSSSLNQFHGRGDIAIPHNEIEKLIRNAVSDVLVAITDTVISKSSSLYSKARSLDIEDTSLQTAHFQKVRAENITSARQDVHFEINSSTLSSKPLNSDSKMSSSVCPNKRVADQELLACVKDLMQRVVDIVAQNVSDYFVRQLSQNSSHHESAGGLQQQEARKKLQNGLNGSTDAEDKPQILHSRIRDSLLDLFSEEDQHTQIVERSLPFDSNCTNSEATSKTALHHHDGLHKLQASNEATERFHEEVGLLFTTSVVEAGKHSECELTEMVGTILKQVVEAALAAYLTGLNVNSVVVQIPEKIDIGSENEQINLKNIAPAFSPVNDIVNGQMMASEQFDTELNSISQQPSRASSNIERDSLEEENMTLAGRYIKSVASKDQIVNAEISVQEMTAKVLPLPIYAPANTIEGFAVHDYFSLEEGQASKSIINLLQEIEHVDRDVTPLTTAVIESGLDDEICEDIDPIEDSRVFIPEATQVIKSEVIPPLLVNELHMIREHVRFSPYAVDDTVTSIVQNVNSRNNMYGTGESMQITARDDGWNMRSNLFLETENSTAHASSQNSPSPEDHDNKSNTSVQGSDILAKFDSCRLRFNRRREVRNLKLFEIEMDHDQDLMSGSSGMRIVSGQHNVEIDDIPPSEMSFAASEVFDSPRLAFSEENSRVTFAEPAESAGSDGEQLLYSENEHSHLPTQSLKVGELILSFVYFSEESFNNQVDVRTMTYSSLSQQLIGLREFLDLLYLLQILPDQLSTRCAGETFRHCCRCKSSKSEETLYLNWKEMKRCLLRLAFIKGWKKIAGVSVSSLSSNMEEKEERFFSELHSAQFGETGIRLNAYAQFMETFASFSQFNKIKASSDHQNSKFLIASHEKSMIQLNDLVRYLTSLGVFPKLMSRKEVHRILQDILDNTIDVEVHAKDLSQVRHMDLRVFVEAMRKVCLRANGGPQAILKTATESSLLSNPLTLFKTPQNDAAWNKALPKSPRKYGRRIKRQQLDSINAFDDKKLAAEPGLHPAVLAPQPPWKPSGLCDARAQSYTPLSTSGFPLPVSFLSPSSRRGLSKRLLDASVEFSRAFEDLKKEIGWWSSPGTLPSETKDEKSRSGSADVSYLFAAHKAHLRPKPPSRPSSAVVRQPVGHAKQLLQQQPQQHGSNRSSSSVDISPRSKSILMRSLADTAEPTALKNDDSEGAPFEGMVDTSGGPTLHLSPVKTVMQLRQQHADTGGAAMIDSPVPCQEDGLETEPVNNNTSQRAAHDEAEEEYARVKSAGQLAPGNNNTTKRAAHDEAEEEYARIKSAGQLAQKRLSNRTNSVNQVHERGGWYLCSPQFNVMNFAGAQSDILTDIESSATFVGGTGLSGARNSRKNFQ